MEITKEMLVNGIGEFMRLDLFTAMPNGISRFAANMVLASFRANPDNFIGQYVPFLKMIGITTDGANFDVERLASYAREAMSDVGKLTIAGFTLDMSDVNKLIGRLK